MADYGVEILVDGAWIPVSTLDADEVSIENGRAKDAGTPDALTIEATLINQDGKLTPRNPQSELFGKVGQGTQMRVTRPDVKHLWIPGGSAANGANLGASTPDAAALDTADLDFRIEVEPEAWDADASTAIASKYLTTGNQRSWWVGVTTDGLMQIQWSPDGTLASRRAVTATARLPVNGGTRITLRWYLDVDNGASSSTVRFYYAYDGVDSTSWVLLSGGTVGSAVSSIFAGTAPLSIGNPPLSISSGNPSVRVYAARLCGTLGGAAVANPNFAGQAAGATSFVDGTGKTWTIDPSSEIREFDVRGVGELNKWPTRWTTFEELKTAPVTAYGLRKRLSRPSAKLRSPLFREATAEDNLPFMVEYWPGEDASGASQLASGVLDGSPMLASGGPSFGASDRIPGSENLITLSTGSSLRGAVRVHSHTGTIAVRMVLDFPADFAPPVSPIVLWETTCAGATGTTRVKWWRLMVDNIGAVRLIGVNQNGLTIAGAVGGNISYDLFGRRQMFGFNVTQNGGNVDWFTFARRIADDLTVEQVQFNATFTAVTFGRQQEVKVAPNGDFDGLTVGHIMVGTSTSLAAGIDTAIVGNAFETAGTRFKRLCRELGITGRLFGSVDESTSMGPQQADTAIGLFDMIADTNGGVIVDSRTDLALEMHTRWSMYNKPVRAPITYDQRGQSPTLLPEEPGDDVVNDMTVERIGGSSYRAIETTGALGTAGLGYALDASATWNLYSDSQLSDAAWWVTYLRTWDEFVYPEVEFDLAKLEALGDASLARAIAALMLTDRIYITNPPADLPKHPIDLMAQGWSETMRTGLHRIKFLTSPGRPWQIGRGGETPADSDGSTLTNPISAVDTSFLVDTVGTPWAEDSAYPLVMWINRAERVSVTNIVGTGSQQTFTATRGIDGDPMPHDAGVSIQLWEPVRLAR